MKATPRFLAEIRGSTKDLTFKTMPDGSIIASRTRPIPTDHRTESQDAVRLAFTQAKNEWNALAQNEKDTYSTQAAPLGITGYNLYLSTRITELLEAPASLDMDFSTDPEIYGHSLTTPAKYIYRENEQDIYFHMALTSYWKYFKRFFDLPTQISLPFCYTFKIKIEEVKHPSTTAQVCSWGLTDTNDWSSDSRTYLNALAGIQLSDNKNHGANTTQGVTRPRFSSPGGSVGGTTWYPLLVGETYTIEIQVTSTSLTFIMDEEEDVLDLTGKTPPQAANYALYIHQDYDWYTPEMRGTIDDLHVEAL